ncbi:DUF5074 domain-containing protein [Pedobacter miscanthi]|jgi:hypothetical protein|uniref:DUF5074 domain-containing protein n=1 Tax=Pedobacter miscanthi TaxID=2259170 RepID=UPI00292ECE48|nr:DUF5074 domain-containing protein [Pedobacter miscanthi]
MKIPLLINKKALVVLALGLGLMAACKKDKTEDPIIKVPVIAGTKGVYMLCEGLMGGKNSAISYYDMATKTTVADYYLQVNKEPLGETANDLEQYGSKMYCVVSGLQGTKQSFLDIIDIKTCKSLKRIAFNSSTDGYMPRFVAFYKDKAYVSRYDGKVNRIDTATMAIDGEVMLSEGLEQLAVANGKLYVCNSSHPLYPKGAKNKVSVIDLATFTKTKDITVNNNPVRIQTADNGDLFVITWNDYITNNEPSLDRISSVSDTKIASYNYDLGTIIINGSSAFVAKDVYTNPDIKALNTTSGALGGSLITDGQLINTIYGLTANPFSKEVMVADANGYNSNQGFAYCVGTDGKVKFSFKTAGLPQHAVFNYKYE